MRRISLALGLMAAACVATAASAETINLTGTYRCIQMCRDGMLGAPTFVTQNGDAVNLTTETGEAYRAWPDWNAPLSRIWIDARGEGAVYSPDGMRIQPGREGGGGSCYLDLWAGPQYIAATCCRPVRCGYPARLLNPRTIEPACRLNLQTRAGS
jgi:hypothetical protein